MKVPVALIWLSNTFGQAKAIAIIGIMGLLLGALVYTVCVRGMDFKAKAIGATFTGVITGMGCVIASWICFMIWGTII